MAEHPVIYEMDEARLADKGDDIDAMKAAAKVLLMHMRSEFADVDDEILVHPKSWLTRVAQDLGIPLEGE